MFVIFNNVKQSKEIKSAIRHDMKKIKFGKEKLNRIFYFLKYNGFVAVNIASCGNFMIEI